MLFQSSFGYHNIKEMVWTHVLLAPKQVCNGDWLISSLAHRDKNIPNIKPRDVQGLVTRDIQKIWGIFCMDLRNASSPHYNFQPALQYEVYAQNTHNYLANTLLYFAPSLQFQVSIAIRSLCIEITQLPWKHTALCLTSHLHHNSQPAL